MIEVTVREKHMESRSYTWCFQHFTAKWFSLRFLGKWGRWFFNFWSTLIMVSRKNRINGWWGNFQREPSSIGNTLLGLYLVKRHEGPVKSRKLEIIKRCGGMEGGRVCEGSKMVPGTNHSVWKTNVMGLTPKVNYSIIIGSRPWNYQLISFFNMIIILWRDITKLVIL